MYAPAQVIETELFTRIPDELKKINVDTEWVRFRGRGPYHSFLEGPSFDRDGYLYCVDIPYGRIFRISPAGDWAVFAEYDGEPNGLRIHKNGTIYVADYKHGILSFDPKTGARSSVCERPNHERFKGVNDLTFSSEGDLYFTDQGRSDLRNPTGAVYRLRCDGTLDVIWNNLPSPNGLVLNKNEDALYIGITNQVIGINLGDNYHLGKAFLPVAAVGGVRGPDGMAVDDEDNIIVVSAGSGTVWVYTQFGEPLYRIKSCAGLRTTNIAYGGPDNRTLFILEGSHGAIMKTVLPVPGKRLFSHQ